MSFCVARPDSVEKIESYKLKTPAVVGPRGWRREKEADCLGWGDLPARRVVFEALVVLTLAS